MSRLNKLNQVWEQEAYDGVMHYPVATLVERVFLQRISDVFPHFRLADRRRLARAFRDLPIIVRSLCHA